MRDRIIEDQIAREREDFIRYITDDKGDSICALASSYHHGTPCAVIAISHGSFNVCVSVQFDSPQTSNSAVRWVVRIPFPGCVPWIDERIDSEVATMMYVAEKTTIPVPKIHAWSYNAQSPIGHAFIIMDHVQGTSLNAMLFRRIERWDYTTGARRSKDLKRVHDQLADLYIQLRSLEFPEIGALGMPTPESPDIAIRHRPMPMELVLQETENLNPSVFFPEKKTFTKPEEYIQALVKLSRNRLIRTQDPDLGSEDSGYEVVFAHEEFYTHVLTKFLMKTRRNGPFVLMHGDMALQGNNLLWDDELNLVAVLDWEFCYTVPTSCFIPPAWINGFSPDPIRAIGRIGIFYDIEVESLTRSIVERSQQQWPASPLKREWQRRAGESNDPHVSVVLALLHPEVIDSAFWDVFMHKFYSPYFLPPKSTKEIADQKLATFRKREDIKKFVRKRVADEKSYAEKYETYVRENGKPHSCQCVSCEEQRGNFENLQQLPMLLHPLDVPVEYESTGPEIPPHSNFKPIPEPKLHPPLPLP
ncbi:APH domain-containing protein [Fusarium sp. Ph1]|nr:APH domain-containing protein [Fusarium sp. Ph1]